MKNRTGRDGTARLLDILEQLRGLHAEQLVLVSQAIGEVKRAGAAGVTLPGDVINLYETPNSRPVKKRA